MEPCKKCHPLIRAHCLHLNKQASGESILCGAIERRVNGKKPLKESTMRMPNENFTKDYKDILNEAQSSRITPDMVQAMPTGPLKLIAACLLCGVGPVEMAEAKIPRSKSGVYEWVNRWMKEGM